MRTAVAFLTRLPVGSPPHPDLTAASAWFPLVGVVVATLALVGWAAGEAVIGPLGGAVTATLAAVVVTGALHEDGLADTVDGLWGGATAERRLEVMRDSRIGTYGTIALVGELLLWVAVLVPLDDLRDAARVLVGAHVTGRAAPLVLIRWLPAARRDGLGAHLRPAGLVGALIAGATVVAALVLTAGVWAPVVLLAAVVPIAALGVAARRRLGGSTGDVLGAGVALAALAAAVAMSALRQAGR